MRLDKAISVATGDSWSMMACVDRMVELGELREITSNDVVGQHRFSLTPRNGPKRTGSRGPCALLGANRKVPTNNVARLVWVTKHAAGSR